MPTSLKSGDNARPTTLQALDDGGLEFELFHHQFKRRVRDFSDSIALDFRYGCRRLPGVASNIAWSYREVHRRASLLAEEICRLMPASTRQDEQVVALCLEKVRIHTLLNWHHLWLARLGVPSV